MTFEILIQSATESSIEFALSGDIDIDTVNDLLDEIETTNKKAIVLNCSKVTFIDSTGAGLVLRKIIEMKKEGRQLKMVSLPSEIYEVLDELGIFEILNEIEGR